MKRTLSSLLALVLCLGLATGCQTKTENSGKVVYPLDETLKIDNLQNCTAAVSLEKGDAYVDDSGQMVMDLTVYAYEFYDMVEMATLEVGDTIVRQKEEVKIETLERLESGLIRINGGEENGGFDLGSSNNTVYYEIGMSDVKAYYEVGAVTLPVSTEFRYVDESDLDAGAKEYYPGDFLTDTAGIDYHFTPHNTSVVIQDGVITNMKRVYTP